MNEVLLVYLWGIWEQFNWVTPVVVITVIASGALYIWSSLAYKLDKPDTYYYPIKSDKYKNKLEENQELWGGFIKYSRPPLIISIVLVVVLSLIPSRNVAVMMVSAPIIVKVADDVADSNATKRLVNVLDKSFNILEKKLEEMD